MQINSSNNLATPDRRQEEYELVCQARDKNDQRAYAALLHSYWDNTHLMLLRITRNETIAEDLTMISFNKAFAALDSFTPQNTFGTWLFRIATNTGIDFLRRKNNSEILIDDVVAPNEESKEYPIPSEDDNPEESVIHDQRLAMLRKAMEQLDPVYKDLVELRYFEEHSYEEIAKILKMPINTVRIRLHRAKNYLRTLLSAMGNDNFDN